MTPEEKLSKLVDLITSGDPKPAALKKQLLWMDQDGYRGVAVGRRLRAGRELDEYVLKVFVQQKRPFGDDLPAIAPTLNVKGFGKVAIDVEAIGDVSLQFSEPVQSGLVVQIDGGLPGRAGCLVRKPLRPRTDYLLSCAHVLGYSSKGPAQLGDTVYAVDTRDGSRKQIGLLSDYRPLSFGPGTSTNLDAALAVLSNVRAIPDLDGHGPPKGVNTNPKTRDNVYFHKDGHWHGPSPIKELNASIDKVRFVDRGQARGINYRGMITCERFSEPGDSGSVVVDRFRRVVGLIVGSDFGDQSARRTYICPIQPILDAFNVELVTGTSSTRSPALDAAAPAESPDLATLKKIAKEAFPGISAPAIDRNMKHVRDGLRQAGIADRQMFLMAIATICAETQGFEPISEGLSRYNTSNFGSPSQGSPYDLYEFRGALGNSEAGDGARFHGRGFVQLTGRYNYQQVGDALGINLIADPDMANDPVVAGRILATFLKRHEPAIREALDQSLFAQARKLVNGGHHGLDRFAECLEVAGRSWVKHVGASP